MQPNTFNVQFILKADKTNKKFSLQFLPESGLFRIQYG